jgi:aspartyl protease family protein
MRSFARAAWFAGTLILGLVASSAGAEPRVHALFSGKAMFSLDGQRFVLGDGETGPGGLRLVRATSTSALVEYEGRMRELTLERGRFGGEYQTRSQPELRIPPSPQGGYTVIGTVNGQSVPFVVDTGATAITLSREEAIRLRLPLAGGIEVPVETASGRVTGQRIVIDSVQLGGIEEQRVDAVVLPGNRPATALLGMSFLGRIDMRSEGSVLVLQAR